MPIQLTEQPPIPIDSKCEGKMNYIRVNVFNHSFIHLLTHN